MNEKDIEKLSKIIGANNIFYDIGRGVHFVLAEKVLEVLEKSEKEDE